jgi:predicted GIY-YIG superfamily endonuclease
MRAMTPQRREDSGMAITEAEQRTALYRFYDSRETLLYVGITSDPWRRWREHVQEKPWYPQVKHQAVTWFDSEPQARRAEVRAIRREKPQFNIAGAVRPASARFNIRFNTILFAGGWWMLSFPCLFFYVGRFAPNLKLLLDVYGLSTLIPMAGIVLVGSAPSISRFACWVTRNFRNPEPVSRSAR